MRRNHPEWFKQDLATLFAMLADQRFDPAVAEVVPLTEVRRAHERVEAGEVQGKLVMRVTEA
jgi:NADPH:quinone reductase-like Zn-dependent oxidoreductase